MILLACFDVKSLYAVVLDWLGVQVGAVPVNGGYRCRKGLMLSEFVSTKSTISPVSRDHVGCGAPGTRPVEERKDISKIAGVAVRGPLENDVCVRERIQDRGRGPEIVDAAPLRRTFQHLVGAASPQGLHHCRAGRFTRIELAVGVGIHVLVDRAGIIRTELEDIIVCDIQCLVPVGVFSHVPVPVDQQGVEFPRPVHGVAEVVLVFGIEEGLVNCAFAGPRAGNDRSRRA